MILHVDGNSFYASCEQIYRPDLRGKPVAVLSNNDGIIIALNKEAKNCGIKRGDPYFKVKNICEQSNIEIFFKQLYTLCRYKQADYFYLYGICSRNRRIFHR